MTTDTSEHGLDAMQPKTADEGGDEREALLQADGIPTAALDSVDAEVEA